MSKVICGGGAAPLLVCASLLRRSGSLSFAARPGLNPALGVRLLARRLAALRWDSPQSGLIVLAHGWRLRPQSAERAELAQRRPARLLADLPLNGGGRAAHTGRKRASVSSRLLIQERVGVGGR